MSGLDEKMELADLLLDGTVGIFDDVDLSALHVGYALAIDIVDGGRTAVGVDGFNAACAVLGDDERIGLGSLQVIGSVDDLDDALVVVGAYLMHCGEGALVGCCGCDDSSRGIDGLDGDGVAVEGYCGAVYREDRGIQTVSEADVVDVEAVVGASLAGRSIGRDGHKYGFAVYRLVLVVKR